MKALLGQCVSCSCVWKCWGHSRETQRHRMLTAPTTMLLERTSENWKVEDNLFHQVCEWSQILREFYAREKWLRCWEHLLLFHRTQFTRIPAHRGTDRHMKTPATPSSGLCTHINAFVHNLQIDTDNKTRIFLKNNSVSFYIVRHRK